MLVEYNRGETLVFANIQDTHTAVEKEDADLGIKGLLLRKPGLIYIRSE